MFCEGSAALLTLNGPRSGRATNYPAEPASPFARLRAAVGSLEDRTCIYLVPICILGTYRLQEVPHSSARS